MKLILYHGTSKENALKIQKEGFKINQKTNWDISSKEGFIYLTECYGPFFAMNCDNKGHGLALIKVEVDCDDCYPEDDFLMMALKKYPYTKQQLNKVNFEDYKYLWKKSIEHLGNVAVKPDKIKILGITFFESKKLLYLFDPIISPINFKIMGNYYKEFSDWIFQGKNPIEFRRFNDIQLPNNINMV